MDGTVDRITDPWGPRTPYGRDGGWPVRVDSCLAAGVRPEQVEEWVRTASLLHSDGDAMDIAVRGGRMVGVRGRAGDRVNRGRLDPKDLFAWQANAAADRLTRPLVRAGGRLVETDWATAMERIVSRSRELLRDRGPGSIGFYTSGQLFLEEYYTLAVLARAGIGTRHLDGNTRLCTATAAEALKESFGSDGQPGSYADFDHADVIALFGHNIAETQCVQWMRILDRLEGADPPRLLCVDPRRTPVARRAAVHLAPRLGTNVALLNALLHEVVRTGRVDPAYIDRHTVGFDELCRQVEPCTPRWAAGICGLPAAAIEEAAELVGTAERLLSTVLQGVYQSHQATAAAVQVNNLHLIRGMLGRPGAGVLQMNGQPTAQNTRECGADGDLPGFRNWQNEEHVADLARVWNVVPEAVPHDGPPTHAMEIFRLAGEGTIGMLWISATNPAVSLPELARVRRILSREGLFTVVQDVFLTETARFADVVLPAATWGEKTGTFTNADRTVHLSEKAVDPPGEARPDLDVFLDYARRMDFRDKDGGPLVPWTGPEAAFEAWKRCSAGRPCDYTGLSYAKLRGPSGIQWPCHEGAPDGTERLYADGAAWAAPEDCETYGKDLLTGEPVGEERYRALNPGGKAVIKAAPYVPPEERPSAAYPFQLTTGRTLYHFHTRTKTGRTPELAGAAPDVWVEVSDADAARLGLGEGDLVDVSTRRGVLRGRLRIAGIRPGVLFVPFHYGYWDTPAGSAPGPGAPGRAANETTATAWDPVSKQPVFKTSAAALTPVEDAGGRRSPAPRTAASASEASRGAGISPFRNSGEDP
ncbi:molybdopterin oxidoreductase family protein [Streptomyces lavendulae]|uniref:molybdopterin oxidoreductase family protein n=1 Tax=Streptomyces lavendulae TaxID=1914 RepID=UPI0024A31732|nr:nitrate reductase [Streptomyces lavendulae]GLX21651.1 nitrate reductase catalytic subunit [Streptomyces lavendulae subsp. lavendulae]GLX29068.1 nitrate reductase catalytic subunit [Streptomyces lavendulae subsp. lavendulae]